jgi:hypothetical protein
MGEIAQMAQQTSTHPEDIFVELFTQVFGLGYLTKKTHSR